MRKRLYQLVLPVLLLGASVVWAVSGDMGYPGTPSIVGTGYKSDKATTALRSAVSSADTLTVAGILATTEYMLNGKQTVIIGGKFSASGATCTIRLAYIYKDAPDSSSTSSTLNKIQSYSAPITLTAATSAYETSYYPSNVAYFDGSANTIRVLITTAVSSGTVDLWVMAE